MSAGNGQQKECDAQVYDQKGYDQKGYDQKGYDRPGYDREGYDRPGYDQKGYDREGYDRPGYDQKGYDRQGKDQQGNDGHKDNGSGNKGSDGHKYNGHESGGMSGGPGSKDQGGKNESNKDQGGNDLSGKDSQGNLGGQDKYHHQRNVDTRPDQPCHGEQGTDSFIFHGMGNWKIDNFAWQEGDTLDLSGYGMTRDEVASHVTNVTIQADTFIVNFGDNVSITVVGQPPTWDNVICAQPL